MSTDVLRALTKHAKTLARLVVKESTLPLSKEGVQFLSTLTELKVLEVDDVEFDGATRSDIVDAFGKLSKIVALADRDGELLALLPRAQLRCYKCRFLTASNLSALESSWMLESLSAEIYEFGDGHFGMIGRFKKLHTLELKFNPNVDVSEPPASSIAALADLKSLRRFVVADIYNFDALASAIAQMAELRELRLGSTGVTKGGLAQIGRLKRLRSVAFDGCEGVTHEALLALCRGSSIRDLDLLRCEGLSSDVVAELSGETSLRTIRLPSLFVDKEVGVTDSKWSDQLLLNLARHSQLEELVLPWGCTGSAFRRVEPLSELHMLDLSRAEAFAPQDVLHIAKFSGLKQLVLSDAQFLHELASVLTKCSQLQKLEVLWESPDTERLATVLSGIPATRLKELVLVVPTASGSLMKSITRHAALRSLELLVQSGCGGDAIARLRVLSSLSKFKTYVAEGQEPNSIAQALATIEALRVVDLGNYEMSREALYTIANQSKVESLIAGVGATPVADLIDVCESNDRLMLVYSD